MIEEQEARLLPKMGTSYKGFYALRDVAFNSKVTPGARYAHLKNYSEFEPVTVSHFVVTEETDTPVPHRPFLANEAIALRKELENRGVFSCVGQRLIKDGNSHTVQIFLFVPNIKPELLKFERVTHTVSQTNVEQIATFIFHLSDLGYIDLHRQEKELQTTYGGQALYWLAKMESLPSPA